MSPCKLLFPLAILGALIRPSAAVAALEVAASGICTLCIGPNELTSGAGGDLVTTVMNRPGESSLTVVGTTGPDHAWRVDVQSSGRAWPAAMALAIRRAGDGKGGGTVAGGLDFVPIGPTPVLLISGAGDRADIPLQARLEGYSIRIPPGSYSTTVTYTIVDL